ncbi:MAG: hypothetical protein R2708_25265 [Vicinamibacterales bacterium]
MQTFMPNPLLGTGFGHPFVQAVEGDALPDFTDYVFLPHNSMLGLWAFTGLVGFTGLFGTLTIAALLAIRARAAAATSDQAIAAVAVIGCLGGYVVHLWADIGFTEAPTIFLVGLMAVAGQLAVATGRAAGLGAGPDWAPRTPSTGKPMTTQRDLDWQRLWLTLRGIPLTSLAVFGIDGASGAEEVVNRLAAVGNLDKKTPVRVISAIGLSLEGAAGVVADLQTPVQPGSSLAVVACDSPRTNPAMIPIVQASSGVVVVVRLGETLLDAVRQTVDGIGRDKVLATVSVG